MKRIVLLLVVLSLGFVVAGCGEDSEGGESRNPIAPSATPTPTTPTPTPTTPNVGNMTVTATRSGAGTYNIVLSGDLNAGLNNPAVLANRVIRVREWSCGRLTVYSTGYANSQGNTVTLFPGIVYCGDRVDISLELDIGTGTPIVPFVFAYRDKVSLVPNNLGFAVVAGEVRIQGPAPQ